MKEYEGTIIGFGNLDFAELNREEWDKDVISLEFHIECSELEPEDCYELLNKKVKISVIP